MEAINPICLEPVRIENPSYKRRPILLAAELLQAMQIIPTYPFIDSLQSSSPFSFSVSAATDEAAKNHGQMEIFTDPGNIPHLRYKVHAVRQQNKYHPSWGIFLSHHASHEGEQNFDITADSSRTVRIILPTKTWRQHQHKDKIVGMAFLKPDIIDGPVAEGKIEFLGLPPHQPSKIFRQ